MDRQKLHIKILVDIIYKEEFTKRNKIFNEIKIYSIR